MKHYKVLVDDNGLSYHQTAEKLDWQQRPDSHDAISNTFASTQVFFHQFDENYWQDWHQCSKNNKRMTIMLSGRMQVTTSDGDSFIVKAGDCITFEDFHGEGHQTQGISAGLAVIVDLQ